MLGVNKIVFSRCLFSVYDQKFCITSPHPLADWQQGEGVDFQVPGMEEVPMGEENFDPSTLDIQQILGMVNNGGTNMEM